jgi:hypothetical protein
MMFYKTLAIIAMLAASGLSTPAQSDVPVISGGAGFIGTTQGGASFFEPVVAPVIAAPIGDHLLIEGRATFLGLISRADGTTGPYQGQFLESADYLQIDYTINSRLTIVVGRFLTPFNIYNERFTPIWIPELVNPPLIIPIGTLTTASSNGAMIRGALVGRDNYEVNYTAYYSASNLANNPNTHFGSARATGGRAGVFFPHARIEFGMSYERYLQDTPMNVFGSYLSWQPTGTALNVKGEYAHSLSGQGYWLQGAYRLLRFRGPDSAIGRLAPVARVQQFFRNQPVSGDQLPGVNTREVDFGLNYYLPHEIRLNGSYGRQFSSQSNANVWNFAVTYRFMFPMWPGGPK